MITVTIVIRKHLDLYVIVVSFIKIRNDASVLRIGSRMMNE